MEDAFFRANIETDGEVTVVSLAGEIDLSTAPIVVAQFEGLAAADLTEVVVDGTGVQFVDSTGLGALLNGQSLIHESGSSFVLVPSRPLERLLELVSAGVPAIQTAETLETALDSVRRQIAKVSG